MNLLVFTIIACCLFVSPPSSSFAGEVAVTNQVFYMQYNKKKVDYTELCKQLRRAGCLEKGQKFYVTTTGGVIMGHEVEITKAKKIIEENWGVIGIISDPKPTEGRDAISDAHENLSQDGSNRIDHTLSFPTNEITK